MKKLFSLVLVAVSLILSQKDSYGTSNLKIVQLVNFPDSAVIGPIYNNIHVWITNTGTPFYGDIHVFIHNQTTDSIDVLRDDPGHPNIWVDTGDTVSVSTNPFFSFRPIYYAAGDNIIVVWPFAGLSVDFETYHTQIFLTDNVGIEDQDKSTISVYPNPVSRTLNINYGNKNTVERVRIYDLFGREIFSANEAVNNIDLSGFREGIYIIEMSEKNGNRIIKKILVSSQ